MTKQHTAEMKRCPDCDKDLPLEDFGSNKARKDGLQNYCKKHAKEKHKAWRKENKEHLNEQSRAWREENKEYTAAYREENKEHVKEIDRAWREKNKERKKETWKDWYKRNKERVFGYRRTRYATDICYRLTTVLRTRLYKAVKNGYKTGSAVRDLGCTIEEFKVYIEEQFTEGMSWDNHGKWHLDHIKPFAVFDLAIREQLLEACHYTNYQPLWAKDNMSKGAKYDVENEVVNVT